MTYPSSCKSRLIEQTAKFVAAYISYNAVPIPGLPGLIETVHDTIANLSAGKKATPKEPMPTEAQIKASVRQDALVSFIDGRSYKTLKRHLRTHGLTPEQYRDRYGLAADYPMIAPDYAARRSNIAKQIGLGHKAA